MLHHGSDTYWLSRQRDMLPSNRIDGLGNSISVTDRSEGQRLVAQTIHAAARVGAIIAAAFTGAGKKTAETFFVDRSTTS